MELKILGLVICLTICSTEAVDRTARIVNGTDATIEEFPFMVITINCKKKS